MQVKTVSFPDRFSPPRADCQHSPRVFIRSLAALTAALTGDVVQTLTKRSAKHWQTTTPDSIIIM